MTRQHATQKKLAPHAHPYPPLFSSLKKSWREIDDFKSTFWLASLYVFLCMLGAALVLIPLHFLGKSIGYAHIVDVILILLALAFYTPMHTGILMLSVKHLRRSPLSAKVVFDYFQGDTIFNLFICFISINIIFILLHFIAQLNIALMIIVMLINACFAVALFFSYLLIADRGFNFINALKLSLSVVIRNPIKSILLLLCMMLLLVIGAATLGIAMIWLQPTINNLAAIYYESIFS